MNHDWKAFLQEENDAKFDNDKLVGFGDTVEEQKPPQSAMLSNLSNYGLIKVSGEDAESFLHNQLTNDIRNISDTTHQISAWCTPKGRIIADFRIFKRNDDYFLVVAADLLKHVIKKLQMYVMMSKVTIEDYSETLIHFGFSGDKAAEDLKELLGNSLANKQAIQYKSLSILQLSDTPPRFEAFGEVDDAKELWKLIKTRAKPVNDNGWTYCNIKAGIPHISQASSESWIPQMVNFIAIEGVDFKKGCYPGQEVVARLNYLGKTKRRMYRIQINTQQLPEIGDIIASETDQEAGKIINAAINPDGNIDALAVLKIAEANKKLTSADAKVSLLELPYSIED